MKAIDKFRAAERAAAPLIAWNGLDQQSIINKICEAYKKSGRAIVLWDKLRGARAVNDERWPQLKALGNAALAECVVGGRVNDEGNLAEDTADAIAAATSSAVGVLTLAASLPGDAKKGGSILILINAHRHVNNDQEPEVPQGIWNLRDPFKADARMLVLLGPQVTLPSEIRNDFVVLNDELPTDKELEEIVVSTYGNAGLKAPEPETLVKCVDALAGLSWFPAETSTSMSIGKKGMDLELLGENKRQMVKNVRGAEIWSGKENWASVVGCKNIVTFKDQLLQNQQSRAAADRIGLIFFMDEVEKMFAGSRGDNTGASQAINEAFLGWTQNTRAFGLLEVGIPGAGKSLVAKAAGGQFGLPVLMASLSKIKQPELGMTEQNAAALFSLASAMASGRRVLMIATSNDISSLTPEIEARFRLGTYFFDYPDEEQNRALWSFYRARYNIPENYVTPQSRNWVGREIETCCELSSMLGIDLVAASRRIVPVSVSRAIEMAKLREACSNRFVSADYDGVFKADRSAQALKTGTSATRALNLAD